jgi:hypothetical protein
VERAEVTETAKIVSFGLISIRNFAAQRVKGASGIEVSAIFTNASSPVDELHRLPLSLSGVSVGLKLSPRYQAHWGFSLKN